METRADAPHFEISERRLANGLRVVVAADQLAPIVSTNLLYRVGSRNDPPGRSGFAHLFEHLMFHGSAHLPRGLRDVLIESAGGYDNAFTWYDDTVYVTSAPPHQLGPLLWAEADRQATLLDAIGPGNLESEREVVKNERREYYDNVPCGDYLFRLTAALFPPGHPYHIPIIGFMDDLDRASFADVSAFFRSFYAPNNAVLSIVGGVDIDEAHALAEHYLGLLRPNPALPAPPVPATVPAAGEVRSVIIEDVPLVRHFVGFRTAPANTPEADAADVLSGIVAMGQGSRLQRDLVRRGLALEPYCDHNALVLMSFIDGSVTVPDGRDPDAVLAALLDQFDDLASARVSDAELERAKAMLITSELRKLAESEQVAGRLSAATAHFDRPELINEQLDRLMAVDAERVRAAAERIFEPAGRVILSYIPSGAAKRSGAPAR